VINALAYTHGNHIAFGEGRYQPNTTAGKHLLAHELMHVVQQQSGLSPTIQAKVIDDKEHLPCRTSITDAAVKITAAENKAATMAEHAAAVLRQRPLPETARESLWKHFKLDYNDALHRCRFVPAIGDRFARIAKAIKDTGVTYDCTATGEPAKECSTAGAVTQVGLFGGTGMALCSGFWKQAPLDQAAWLLHEWVHFEFGQRGAGDELPGGFDTAGCYASFAIEADGRSTGPVEEYNCHVNTKPLPPLNSAFINKVPCPGNVFVNVTGTTGIAVGSFPAKTHFLSTELGIDYLFPLSRMHDWELSVGARYTHFKPSKPEEDAAYSLGARVGLQFRHQPWRFGLQFGGYAEGGGINIPEKTGRDITHPYLGGGVVGGINIPLGRQSSLQIFVDVGERFGLDTGDANQVKWFQTGIGIALQAQ
jgi:hypothetical protein